MTALGPFTLEHPFLLAPMAGITHSPYRRLMRRLGSSLVVSELISATGIEYIGKKTLELLQFDNEERTLGLQIFGEDIGHLVNACRYIENLGADFVDLNMGCPVPKVVKKGAGAALCRNTPELYKILKAMVESVKIPVTIKIRTGWDSDTKNANDVVKVAHEAGVRWVAIHGRTRAQGYSGLADWDFIGNVKAKTTMPIIGNGDVQTPEQAVERYKTYGVDAVMIGRGALRNPFIFRQAADLLRNDAYAVSLKADYLKMLNDQRELFLKSFGDYGALLHSKKFLAWYSAGFAGASAFRQKVFSSENFDSLWTDGLDFFSDALAARDSSYMSEPFLMGGHG